MVHKIPFKIAVNAMILLLSSVLLFHILVLVQLLPYSMVWGGKLQNVAEMRKYEAVSIMVIGFIIFIVASKGGYLKNVLKLVMVDVILWILIVFFALNTVGNLLSETTTETIVFTPLTLLSVILCFRLVREGKGRTH